MKVNIIGTGNVATHFINHLKSRVIISTVYSRDLDNAKKMAVDFGALAINNLSDIDVNADLTIIMVNDSVVKDIAKQLPKDLPVVHTSGSIPIDVFSGFKNFGILYPLQSFSKDSPLDISLIPFLIEANNSLFENNIIEFCEQYLSKNIHITTSQLRSEIHLAAVISNNFITHLLAESESVLKSNDLSLDILSPLITETIKKAFKIGPVNAQTGPAKRNDINVMEKQVERISNLKLKKIYKLMSALIQENNI
jgi:predicted short-subunit dehydrogenase-like oxidoreductase (DUF2520 family)